MRVDDPDRVFRFLCWAVALGLVALVAGIGLTLLAGSLPSLKAFGVRFLWGRVWDPVNGEFGALPFLVGTLLTSFLALALAAPFALSSGIFLAEYAPAPLAGPLSALVELLAGIPSVIYGLWALFYLVPLVRWVEMKVGAPPFGLGLPTASLVLAIMILPYAASITREVLRMVPHELKEAAYGLGATRWEVIRGVSIPYGLSGIVAGFLLSLGRALGETMAVTMVIGNRSEMPRSPWDLANTMASVIANEFTEASKDIHLAALIEIGLLLFLITLVVNTVARIIIVRLEVR
ncbi:phosphate ABC transporter permease subunit PstC [Thermosulfurimonas sp. F29]|uniref:phosphate ABC transporter permease subunit PstC n=1 Tax=Thermosulfurimonas sp. F29 TaxID=2867247 RepID=UPI001C830E9C|nr:phosphate ABC transporter permease subunit PstC [Thermosulfurimonas sp. F29]MBX6422332.1 phosphate ABC transporter permease subunit PstC [Thermosulfurimonas sp. F29]